MATGVVSASCSADATSVGRRGGLAWLASAIQSNGKIDATAMAKEMGTTTRNYEKNSNTQAFIKALEKQIGKDVIEGKNGNASRLYHPRLALDFARWHDPTFAVQLNDVLMAYITGNITSEESAATARALHEVSLYENGPCLPIS